MYHAAKWDQFVDRVARMQAEKVKADPDMLVLVKKFKQSRCCVMGKCSSVKNTAFQSHVLRLIVRALLVEGQRNEFDIGAIERIFRFSFDELIIKVRGQDRLSSSWTRSGRRCTRSTRSRRTDFSLSARCIFRTRGVATFPHW